MGDELDHGIDPHTLRVSPRIRVGKKYGGGPERRSGEGVDCPGDDETE
jgi:hypothetical protein